MSRPRALAGCLLGVVALIAGCGSHDGPGAADRAAVTSKHCSIVDKGTYYDVLLDYSGGVSAKTIGTEYGKLIKQVMPNFETEADQYIADTVGSNASYQIVCDRIKKLKPQVPSTYRDEVEGLASQCSGGSTNARGDHKLSVDEVYFFSLLPDVARVTQCSGISVFGSRSATGQPITARLLDWDPWPFLARTQAVITIRNGAQSVCLIGYLGCQTAVTAFNEDGVFGAMLDSPVGTPYPNPTGRRSYGLDLRRALETTSTLSAAAAYLSSSTRRYCYNHLILFSDAQCTKVLENDLVSGGPRARALRASNSPLNPGVTWGLGNAMGAVNSFVLLGNSDNHSGDPYNYERWASLRRELSAKGKTVTRTELKAVARYHATDLAHWQDGDLYTRINQMIVIAEPATMHFEVAFRPRSNVLPEAPVYTSIPTRF